MNNIFFSSGQKGGVGKSLVSLALIDYLTALKHSVHLIESDTSNPDVGKAHESTAIPVTLNQLDDIHGWMALLDTLEQNPVTDFIVNTAARSQAGFERHYALLLNSLSELQLNLETFWVINPDRDSLQLLVQYRKLLPGLLKVHVVKNGYFCDDSDFEMYNNSSLKKEIEACGGLSIFFPKIASRVAKRIYSERLSIDKAASTLTLSERAELSRWRTAVSHCFQGVVS